MILRAYYLKKGKPVRADIDVTEKSYWLVRKKLEAERIKIINIFKIMKKQSIITTIRHPRNKQLQPYLDDLVTAKREIIKTLDKLKILFT